MNTHTVRLKAFSYSISLECQKDDCDWFHDLDTRRPYFDELAAIAEEHENLANGVIK